MSDLYNRIVRERGSLERLVARIPGFKGYQDKQARRTADRMLRDYIAEQIDQRINRFVRIEQLLLDSGGLAYMTRTRNVKGKLGLWRDRIKTAAPGYSGMWAQMKIGPAELDRLYSFDEAQVRYLDQLDLKLEQLQQAAGSQEGIDQALVDVDAVVTEAIDAFALRDDELTNFSQSV